MSGHSSKAERTLARILDAALECYAREGIAGTGMDDVARCASIGRTTIYRYVDNRDDLLARVLLRDAEQQQQEMQMLAQYHENLADNLIETVVYIMRGRRTRPINKLLFGSSERAMIDRINLSPAAFYGMTQSSMRPLFEQAQRKGEIRKGVTLELLGQWVARVILSLVTYPENFLEDEAELRHFLEVFLVPSVIKSKD